MNLGEEMRVALLSMFFVVCATNGALAWRCTDPVHPDCPGGLCVNDPKMKSDYCAKGIIFATTPLGPSITVTSPEAAASMRRFKDK